MANLHPRTRELVNTLTNLGFAYGKHGGDFYATLNNEGDPVAHMAGKMNRPDRIERAIPGLVEAGVQIQTFVSAYHQGSRFYHLILVKNPADAGVWDYPAGGGEAIKRAL